MVRRDGAEIRRERIQQIGRSIQSLLYKQPEIPLSKTLAMLQYQFGLKKDKLMEYLGILQDLGRFTIDDKEDKIQKISEG